MFFSGGKASFASADDAKTRFPNANIVLYFTDTLWENPDLYRFILEASDKLELPLLIHSLGLTPLQLMFKNKIVFNNMIGDCSVILKQKVSRDFLKKGLRPPIEEWHNRQFLKNEDFITDAVLYFGIGFDEMHREPAIRKNWQPFQVEMPLIERNIWKDKVLKKYGIRQPVLYDYGFSHNNCNGRCVKAGQGHYKLLKDRMPDVFDKIMEQEYHIKMYVSAYRYIIKGNDPKDKDPIPLEDRIPLHVQKIMLQELDAAYRDYFYDRVEKPKLYIHPAASATPVYMHIQQYSFMKKGSKPYPIRELHLQDEKEKAMYGGVDLIDKYDIGGCGCFLEDYVESADNYNLCT